MDSKVSFLYFYSVYLNGQTQRSSRMVKVANGAEAPAVAPELNRIQSQLEKQEDSLDGFLLYILGLILIDKENFGRARDILLRSVTKYPCNWSAWKALQAGCNDVEVLKNLRLPDHFMSDIFKSQAYVQFQMNEEALQIANDLSRNFPSSDALLLATASAHNQIHNHDEALKVFNELLVQNPFRIEVGVTTIVTRMFCGHIL